MKENLQEKLSVSIVARHCAISDSGLEKNFQKYAQMGVMKYFLNMKLEYAAQLLCEEYTVNYIAELLHFSSSAHFSMAFRNRYEMSPREYKTARKEKISK